MSTGQALQVLAEAHGVDVRDLADMLAAFLPAAEQGGSKTRASFIGLARAMLGIMDGPPYSGPWTANFKAGRITASFLQVKTERLATRHRRG